VPVGIKPTVEKLFDVHRELDGSELEHCLLGLDVGMPCSPSFVPS
jgi:ribonuclease Z